MRQHPPELTVRGALEVPVAEPLRRPLPAREPHRIDSREPLRVDVGLDDDPHVDGLDVVLARRIDPLELLVAAVLEQGLGNPFDRDPRQRVPARAQDGPVELARDRRRRRPRLERDQVALADAGRVSDQDVGQPLVPGVRHALARAL